MISDGHAMVLSIFQRGGGGLSATKLRPSDILAVPRQTTSLHVLSNHQPEPRLPILPIHTYISQHTGAARMNFLKRIDTAGSCRELDVVDAGRPVHLHSKSINKYRRGLSVLRFIKYTTTWRKSFSEVRLEYTTCCRGKAASRTRWVSKAPLANCWLFRQRYSSSFCLC
jgi:hypothetical protein